MRSLRAAPETATGMQRRYHCLWKPQCREQNRPPQVSNRHSPAAAAKPPSYLPRAPINLNSPLDGYMQTEEYKKMRQ